MGVPPELRLHGDTLRARHEDSGDMPSFCEIEPRTFLVIYDVPAYHETWNSGCGVDAAIRMVEVRLTE